MAMTTTHPPTTADQDLSAECELGERPGYENLHGTCTQLADVRMPGNPDIILVRRCDCSCHRWGGAS